MKISTFCTPLKPVLGAVAPLALTLCCGPYFEFLLFQVCGGAYSANGSGDRDPGLLIHHQWKKKRISHCKFKLCSYFDQIYLNFCPYGQEKRISHYKFKLSSCFEQIYLMFFLTGRKENHSQ